MCFRKSDDAVLSLTHKTGLLVSVKSTQKARCSGGIEFGPQQSEKGESFRDSSAPPLSFVSLSYRA